MAAFEASADILGVFSCCAMQWEEAECESGVDYAVLQKSIKAPLGTVSELDVICFCHPCRVSITCTAALPHCHTCEAKPPHA